MWYFEFEAFAADGFRELNHLPSTFKINQSNIGWNIGYGRVFQFVPNFLYNFLNTTPQSINLFGPFLWYSQIIIGCLYLLNFLSKEFDVNLDNHEKVLFIALITLFPYFIEYTFFKYSTANFGVSLSTLSAIVGPILLFKKSSRDTLIGILLTVYTFNYYTPLFVLSAGVFLLIYFFSLNKEVNFKISSFTFPLKFIISIIISFCCTLWVFPWIYEITTGIEITTRAVDAAENKMLIQNVLNIPIKFFDYFLNSDQFGSKAMNLFSLILIFTFLITYLYSIKDKKYIHFILKGLLIMAFLTLPFLIPVLALGDFSTNTRLYSFVGIVFSFLFISSLKTIPRRYSFILKGLITCILVCYVVFNNTAVSNQIEILKKDLNLANRLVYAIENVDSFQEKSLIVIGKSKRHNQNSIISYRLTGNSIFNLGGWRVVHLLNYVSSYNFKVEKNKDVIKEYNEKYRRNKKWPDKDSVITDGDYLIIKL